jgi:hypothetical protein
MKLTAETPAFALESLEVIPRAMSTAGITTTPAPYSADQNTDTLPITAPARQATVKPTATWVATTLHGDTGGFRSRRAFAS